MQHRHIFEAVDRTLRDIIQNESEVFGGKTVVFGGDFRQVLPVIPKTTQGQLENACIKNSILWDSVETLRLTENMRVWRNIGNLPLEKVHVLFKLLDLKDSQIKSTSLMNPCTQALNSSTTS